MARYIDADALYKETQKKIAEANSYRMAVVDGEFLDLINDAETEDVVPRSEVAPKKDHYFIEDGRPPVLIDTIENRRKEVAREIIADIDNRLHDMAMEYHNAGHPEYFAVCEVIHHKVLRAVEKKYVEQDCRDCKHFVGCECFDGKVCDQYERKE